MSFSVQRILPLLSTYLDFCAAFLLILFVNRVWDIYLTAHILPAISAVVFFQLRGFIQDLLLYTTVCSALLLPYVFLSLYSRKLAVIFVSLLVLLLVYVDLMLNEYLQESGEMLDQVIFYFSLHEIKYIALASSHLNLLVILPYIVLPPLYILFLRWCSRIRLNPAIALPILALFIFSSLFMKQNRPKERWFKNLGEYYIVENKTSYFIGQADDYLRKMNQALPKDFDELVRNYQQLYPSRQFTSLKYPLVYTPDQADVLGPFFRKPDQPPNLVFIIVESLGRVISGENASFGSFTPYLDSLASKSLYWENCLSTSERTFGVLPSIFSSAPYGKNGFLELMGHWPNHESLIHILKTNGYACSFFYGGWAGFQNMEEYLRNEGVDHFIEKWDSTTQQTPKDASGFSWGWEDKSTMQNALATIQAEKIQDPRLDIYLTLSTHSPFLLAEQKEYDRKLDQYLQEAKLTRLQTRDDFLRMRLETYLYTDDAIRYLIDSYRKRPGFDHTIFIITGDHHAHGIPKNSELINYHVPLIIYSPLLKRPAHFRAVTTQLDITPSLLAFLSGNCKLQSPKSLAWSGGMLDTFRTFRCLKKVAFMRSNREMLDYLEGRYFFSEQAVYTVDSLMRVQPLTDNAFAAVLQSHLTCIQKIGEVVCEHDLLLPRKIK